MMEFILIKLQACRYSVETATLLLAGFIRDYIWNVF